MAQHDRYAMWKPTSTYKVTAVGMSYYRDAIEAIAQNEPGKPSLVICLAYLMPYNTNPHDPSAVGVVIEGKRVAHLSRSYAPTYREIIKDLPPNIEYVCAMAMITKGLVTNERTFEYLIELDIPDCLTLYFLPDSVEKVYGVKTERMSCYAPLQVRADGSYEATVWVPTPDFNELHKSRDVMEWTTPQWNEVNFYVGNRQGIGLGHKIYSLHKDRYTELFGPGPTTGILILNESRFATMKICSNSSSALTQSDPD